MMPPQTTQAGKRITIETITTPRSEVLLVGSFNDWNPQTATKMIETNGHPEGYYVATLTLLPGVYKYKLLVNGEWAVDAKAELKESNPFGTLDSVLHVG
jgi:hypothetical protein